MGFRFRKRVRILPGLYWNIGGKRSSMSVKIGGLTKNFSSRGTRTTVSLRGTGLSYTSFKTRRKQAGQALPPPHSAQQPQNRGFLGTLVTVIFGLFIGLTAIGVIINVIAAGLSHPPPPATAATRTPQSQTVTAPIASAPTSKPEPAMITYTGTAETSFGKDWVIVDGKKIEGVDILIPEHEGMVTIIHTGGGVNVQASKLPQGFLNAWAMTPEALQAYDKTKGAAK